METYISHLKSRSLYTPAQIDTAVSRIELYANTHRQHPGFFDNVIACGMTRKHLSYFIGIYSLMLFDDVLTDLSVR